MTYFRLLVCVAGFFSFTSNSTINAQLLRRLDAGRACSPVQNCPSITHYSTSTPWAARTVQNRYAKTPGFFQPRCVTNNVCVPHVACEQQCACIDSCIIVVPNTVEQTKTYTVYDPTAQIKEDIKRVKDKLDAIQPGPDPSLKKLQNDLQEIKELLKKNPNPTTQILERVESCEQIYAAIVGRAHCEWLDAPKRRSVQAKMISRDSKNVILERSDGKIFSVDIEKLSKNDQEYVLGIQ